MLGRSCGLASSPGGTRIDASVPHHHLPMVGVSLADRVPVAKSVRIAATGRSLGRMGLPRLTVC